MADEDYEVQVSNGRGYEMDGIAFKDRGSMERYQAMRRKGGINLELVGTVGAGVAKVFEGMQLDRRVEKIAAARRDLRRAREAEYVKLKAFEDAVGVSGLVQAAKNRDEAQDRLDRNQTLALADAVDGAYVSAGAEGVKALGIYGRDGGGYGGGGGGGGDEVAAGVVGGGVGFLLGNALLDDDDDDDGYRRRRR